MPGRSARGARDRGIASGVAMLRELPLSDRLQAIGDPLLHGPAFLTLALHPQLRVGKPGHGGTQHQTHHRQR